MNKDLDHREQFNADSIEQFYIKKVGEDQFNLMIIYKKMEVNHESDLLSFGHKRIAEITDILDYMHQFYGITPKKIEDEYNYDKKTNFIPKQKRNFFKLFDQDIEDIRTKGVFTLSGEDYLVEKTQQIEWDNGMVSYRFLIHEDQSLFYHPMINNRLLFLESKALKANIDGFDRYVDSLNEQPKVLSFEGQNYYLLEVNKGEISMDGKHLHEELLQTIYESEDEKCVLRCSQMEDKIRVFKGTMMQEKQINLILPQLDVDF
ncbi:hypothetical protein [Flammeovirga pacifica]|nr:hypothetical protein [Flammeovirga pacifica]